MKEVEEMNIKEFIINWYKGMLIVFCILLSVSFAVSPIVLGMVLGTFVNARLLHLLWLVIFTLPVGVWLFIQTVFNLPDKLWNE